jgi:hypothetical protein
MAVTKFLFLPEQTSPMAAASDFLQSADQRHF